jgi:hypothetical protein
VLETGSDNGTITPEDVAVAFKLRKRGLDRRKKR